MELPLLSTGSLIVPELTPVPVAPPVLPTPVQLREVSLSEVLARSPRTLEFSAGFPPSEVTPVPEAIVPLLLEPLEKSSAVARAGPWLDGAAGPPGRASPLPCACATTVANPSNPAISALFIVLFISAPVVAMSSLE